MAQFFGSVQEFHHFIGPRIRNVINTAAAPYRKRLGGICQDCGEHAELQSAHVHGYERRVLIERVLADYARPEGGVACNLDEVERRIIEAHMPIDRTFRFICHPCHVIYDAGAKGRPPRRDAHVFRQNEYGDQFKKLGRIALWANRPAQANHKIIKAFLHLAASGDVELSNFRDYCENGLGISGFNKKYASMKTDAGNSYGKVFFDDGRTVQMWPLVRDEVKTYF